MASPLKKFLAIRQSRVPRGGWNQKAFRSPLGLALLKDMVAIHRIEVAKGIVRTSSFYKKLIAEQVRDIVRRATAKLGVKSAFAESVSFDAPMGEAEMLIWMSAIEDVMNETEEVVKQGVRNAGQSVAGGVFDKTSLVLDYLPSTGAKVLVSQKVNQLANQVVSIQNTTKNTLQKALAKGIDEGITVRDMVKRIESKIPSMSTNRAATIARTEMSRAADIGRVTSIQQSGSVTHVSVTGCEAVEEGSPMYGGRHTCNIQNVPANDAHLLRFHPNHTGTIIPSRFIEDTTPVEALSNGPEVALRENRPAYIPPEQL